MPDEDQPVTRADLNRATETLAETIGAAIAAAEQRAAERSRDARTEILRGIEAFARGNFSRMHRLEISDADTNARLGALEERVLYLETRRPPSVARNGRMRPKIEAIASA